MKDNHFDIENDNKTLLINDKDCRDNFKINLGIPNHKV